MRGETSRTLSRAYSRFYIDGEWQEPDSGERLDVVSPHSGQVIGHVPMASTVDVDRAVEAARKAFWETDWSRRGVDERAELCERLATLIKERQPEFSELIVEELGCTRAIAEFYHSVAPTLHWNYAAAVGRDTSFAELREADLSSLAGGGAGASIVKFASKSLVVKEPVGVVAVFCAYNFAFPCVGQKAGPALMAGCTVVLKVPDPDPLALFALADLITEAGFPPGVINILAAGPEASEHLVRHPDVDMVSFTGSTTVGKLIGKACAETVKPCVLELGGKSAAIVLEDADVDAILPVLVGISVGTSQGQSCVCMSRFVVPRSRYDEIAEKLTAAFASLKVGDPVEPDTVIGPLVSQAQQERVLGYVEQAIQEGAKVATGGKAPAGFDGFYVEPTLLTNVTNDMTVAQEELFGPVVALIAFDDEDDAVRIANDSRYGLAGCVFTADTARGFEIARRIRTGTFSVNTFAADFNAPFGGYKESGVGREHGPEAIQEYLLTKTISVDPDSELPSEVLALAGAAAAPA
jgi:aldehyde dehydrogenase (NAD+)